MTPKNDTPKTAATTSMITAAISPSAAGYFGCVDSFGDRITGWVVKAGAEQETLAVEVRADEDRLGTAYCVTPRPDVSAITGRPNTAGFSLPVNALRLPARLLSADDPTPVRLSFRIKGTDLGVPALVEAATTVGDLKRRTGLREPASQSMSAVEAAIRPYVEEIAAPTSPTDEAARVIAFYLPQYHPVPENDEWWGKGFTEWTNVAQGKPQFPGHHQPHVPGELGYYDLRLPETREAQARLAREHGVYGFCYYYYWFNGRRILERPLQEVFESGKPDFPFCICWANETWSRRWDGSENEVLLKQEHTPEGDLEFIRDVIPLMKDPRYIRVNGAPLLMVYRASLFPDLRRTADSWRKVCAEEGIPQIHLCVVESFGFNDPYSVGFDSSVQFPPHGVSASEISAEVDGVAPDFEGKIYDYEEVVASELTARAPKHRRFDGVMLSWDNTARRKNRSHIFKNASPELYEVWLRHAVAQAKARHAPGERLVFVNAWNEWAEGTHLEPDTRHGRAYLEATRRVLTRESDVDVLIDFARKRRQLDGQELTDWLDDVANQMATQRVLARQAERLARRNHALTDSGTVATSAMPYPLRVLPIGASGQVYFERMNGQPMGVLSAAQQRSATLYLEGWCLHPEATATGGTVSYLMFEQLESKQRYYAPVFGRQPRHDVAAALSDVPDARSLFSGFRAYVDINALEPGEYRLGFAQVGPTSIALNFNDGVIRVG